MFCCILLFVMTMIDPDDYILLYIVIVMTMIDPDDYILLYAVIFQCLQFRSVDYRCIWFFNVIVDFPINIVNK